MTRHVINHFKPCMPVQHFKLWLGRKVSTQIKLPILTTVLTTVAINYPPIIIAPTSTGTYRAKRSALSQQMTTRLHWTEKKTWQTQNINNKKDPQTKHRLGTVSNKTFTGGITPSQHSDEDHYRHASEMPCKWRFAGVPMVVRLYMLYEWA